MRTSFVVALLTVSLAAGAANAAQTKILFSDDFDAETPRLGETSSLGKWGVIGEIDVIDGANNVVGVTCAGRCIDLSGTSGSAVGFVNATPFNMAGGRRVTVSFQISGNQRNADTVFFTMNAGQQNTNSDWQDFVWNLDFTQREGDGSVINTQFGSAFLMLPVAGADPFRTFGFSFTPSVNSVMQFNIGNLEPGINGPLLDNVLITQAGGAVPEPTSWAMLITGFGLTGAAARRRRTTVSAA